ncbi:MAG: 4-hydroxybenzoate octaprenyltransferase [Phycisphaerales bacterium]|nr:4-hydroxybenzoate octaprenyltransferase [Phycisphaerales bacterium]
MTTTPATAQRGLLGTTAVLARDIKLAHSVFALPFALLGLFLAAWPADPTLRIGGQQLFINILLVIAAMVTARTAAMLANRWLDRDIDARNPRTAGRALPAGATSSQAVLLGLVFSSMIFMLICLLFLLLDGNWWPLVLGLPVLAWLCLYPVMKRVTWGCHLWLGASLAWSPLAAAIAVRPDALVEQGALWLLAAMVLFWVSGFDIIYALQDIDVDRRERLHSIPARFGINGALWISRLLHMLAGSALILAWVVDQRLGAVFLGASIAACLLLLIEQATVRRWGTTRMALTFFTLNGIVSCVIGLAGILDLAY